MPSLSSSLIRLSLLFGVVFCSKLVFLEKSSEEDGIALVAKLSNIHDVRGDYGNFVLIVDKEGKIKDNIIFSSFDDSLHSYFVVERSFLLTPVLEKEENFLHGFEFQSVMDKYIVAVPVSIEDEFHRAIPHGFEIVLMPKSALPAPHLNDIEMTMAPDPKIATYISGVNSADLKAFTTYLSGEATSSNILTRQAQSTGAVSAQNWLVQQYTSFGFTVTTQAFRSGYSSNVIAKLPGKTEPNRLVLVTAHYDSRGPTLSSTTERAPGANDNGSGTGGLLQIAKLISTNKISFAYTVVLMSFSGEEQGLYGSAYAAQQLKNEGADVVAVLNADMIGYRAPNESPQLAFATRSSTPALITLLTNVTKTYVTGLTVGGSTACCTDHASFYNQGFPATSYFERNGAIADPQYHKSGDLVNRVGYDLETQYPLIVKSVFAGLLTVAKYV